MTYEQSTTALQGDQPHCPQCEDVELRRHGRVGFWQRVVMPRFGLFPWECGLCRKIFFLPQRSTDYRQHATEYHQHALEEKIVPLKLELVRVPGGSSTASTAPKATPELVPARSKRRAL